MTRRLRWTPAGDGSWHLPELVSADLGFFSSYGLEIERVTAGGGLDIVSRLLDGDIDVATGGIWRPLLHNQNEAPLRAFGQLTQYCPFSLYAREPMSKDWRHLAGSVVVVPSQAPSPTVLLHYALRSNGVDPRSVRLVHGLRADEAHELFLAGLGDLCLAGPPAAQMLRRRGAHEVLTLAQGAGPVPWTVFYSTIDTIRRRGEDLVSFARAIDDGLGWVRTARLQDHADLICRVFPGLPKGVAVDGVRWCRAHHVWPTSTVLDLGALDVWQHALVKDGLLDSVSPHEAIVKLPEIGR